MQASGGIRSEGEVTGYCIPQVEQMIRSALPPRGGGVGMRKVKSDKGVGKTVSTRDSESCIGKGWKEKKTRRTLAQWQLQLWLLALCIGNSYFGW